MGSASRDSDRHAIGREAAPMIQRLNRATAWRLGKELDARVLAFQLGFEASVTAARLARVLWWAAGLPRSSGWASGPLRSIRRSAPLLPRALFIETSSACAGRCRDCYVPVADRAEPSALDASIVGSLLEAAARWRADFVCLVGGEPLDASIAEQNLELVAAHPRLRFLICTGAAGRRDEALLTRLRALPNLSLLCSFDGFEQTHDRIRGTDSFARCSEFARRFSRGGRRVCGASITLRADNWRETTSGGFVAALCALGCNYAIYDPCQDATSDTLSAADFAQAIARLRAQARTASLSLFANPFGQLRADRPPRHTMRTLSIDYHGNAFGSRRGHPFGNLVHDDVEALVRGPLVQAWYERCRAATVDSRIDSRGPLFEGALRQLG